MRAVRRRFELVAFAAPLTLGVACNAIFGFEDPVHRPDAVGGAAGETASGGTATGGSNGGGSSGDASGGKGGTAGKGGTDGAGGSAGTSGDSGAGGDGGTATGGTSGSGGGGTCPGDPTDCEPADPPSCAGLSAQACAGESCCASPPVEGCTSCAFPPPTTETYSSTVSPFRLDRFEVTVARFRKFVQGYSGPPASGAGQQPNVVNTGWSPAWDALIPTDPALLVENVTRCGATGTYTENPGPNDQKPMNCVTWYEAFAFCAWDGGFLPSEIQRGFAAAGGTEARYYPWDDDLTTYHAVYGYCDMGVSPDCSVDAIPEVGSKPLGVGKYGQLDLTGSMWEWVFDFDGGDFPIVNPCSDCANRSASTNMRRQIRGGGWTEDATWMPGLYRDASDPADSYWDNVGVRCARAP